MPYWRANVSSSATRDYRQENWENFRANNKDVSWETGINNSVKGIWTEPEYGHQNQPAVRNEVFSDFRGSVEPYSREESDWNEGERDLEMKRPMSRPYFDDEGRTRVTDRLSSTGIIPMEEEYHNRDRNDLSYPRRTSSSSDIPIGRGRRLYMDIITEFTEQETSPCYLQDNYEEYLHGERSTSWHQELQESNMQRGWGEADIDVYSLGHSQTHHNTPVAYRSPDYFRQQMIWADELVPAKNRERRDLSVNTDPSEIRLPYEEGSHDTAQESREWKKGEWVFFAANKRNPRQIEKARRGQGNRGQHFTEGRKRDAALLDYGSAKRRRVFDLEANANSPTELERYRDPTEWSPDSFSHSTSDSKDQGLRRVSVHGMYSDAREYSHLGHTVSEEWLREGDSPLSGFSRRRLSPPRRGRPSLRRGHSRGGPAFPPTYDTRKREHRLDGTGELHHRSLSSHTDNRKRAQGRSSLEKASNGDLRQYLLSRSHGRSSARSLSLGKDQESPSKNSSSSDKEYTSSTRPPSTRSRQSTPNSDDSSGSRRNRKSHQKEEEERKVKRREGSGKNSPSTSAPRSRTSHHKDGTEKEASRKKSGTITDSKVMLSWLDPESESGSGNERKRKDSKSRRHTEQHGSGAKKEKEPEARSADKGSKSKSSEHSENRTGKEHKETADMETVTCSPVKRTNRLMEDLTKSLAKEENSARVSVDDDRKPVKGASLPCEADVHEELDTRLQNVVSDQVCEPVPRADTSDSTLVDSSTKQAVVNPKDPGSMSDTSPRDTPQSVALPPDPARSSGHPDAENVSLADTSATDTQQSVLKETTPTSESLTETVDTSPTSAQQPVVLPLDPGLISEPDLLAGTSNACAVITSPKCIHPYGYTVTMENNNTDAFAKSETVEGGVQVRRSVGLADMSERPDTPEVQFDNQHQLQNPLTPPVNSDEESPDPTAFDTALPFGYSKTWNSSEDGGSQGDVLSGDGSASRVPGVGSTPSCTDWDKEERSHGVEVNGGQKELPPQHTNSSDVQHSDLNVSLQESSTVDVNALSDYPKSYSPSSPTKDCEIRKGLAKVPESAPANVKPAAADTVSCCEDLGSQLVVVEGTTVSESRLSETSGTVEVGDGVLGECIARGTVLSTGSKSHEWPTQLDSNRNEMTSCEEAKTTSWIPSPTKDDQRTGSWDGDRLRQKPRICYVSGVKRKTGASVTSVVTNIVESAEKFTEKSHVRDARGIKVSSQSSVDSRDEEKSSIRTFVGNDEGEMYKKEVQIDAPSPDLDCSDGVDFCRPGSSTSTPCEVVQGSISEQSDFQLDKLETRASGELDQRPQESPPVTSKRSTTVCNLGKGVNEVSVQNPDGTKHSQSVTQSLPDDGSRTSASVVIRSDVGEFMESETKSRGDREIQTGAGGICTPMPCKSVTSSFQASPVSERTTDDSAPTPYSLQKGNPVHMKNSYFEGQENAGSAGVETTAVDNEDVEPMEIVEAEEEDDGNRTEIISGAEAQEPTSQVGGICPDIRKDICLFSEGQASCDTEKYFRCQSKNSHVKNPQGKGKPESGAVLVSPQSAVDQLSSMLVQVPALQSVSPGIQVIEKNAAKLKEHSSCGSQESSQVRKGKDKGDRRSNTSDINITPNKERWTEAKRLKIESLRKKKEQLEEIYKGECLTFIQVAKMMVSKDPNLATQLQESVRQNLLEMGQRCVQELETFARQGTS